MLDDIDMTTIKQQAEKAWAGATENQQTATRFGMTDIALMQAAGYDIYSKDEQNQEMQKQFVLALMDLATKNGGMRA